MLETVTTAATALGGALVVLLTLLYVFYEQVLAFVAWLLHGLFFAGLLLALSALLLEGSYADLAAGSVERSGIPARLRAGDEFVRRVQSLPDRILERVKRPLQGGDPAGAQMGAVDPALPPGALESAVLPVLERGTRSGLRVLSFALGIALMSVGLVSRSGVDLVLADRALRLRVTALEERLAGH